MSSFGLDYHAADPVTGKGGGIPVFRPSTCAHVTGAATGDPSRARGEKAPTAVVPEPSGPFSQKYARGRARHGVLLGPGGETFRCPTRDGKPAIAGHGTRIVRDAMPGADSGDDFVGSAVHPDPCELAPCCQFLSGLAALIRPAMFFAYGPIATEAWAICRGPINGF
jgi:hypothetical protein